MPFPAPCGTTPGSWLRTPRLHIAGASRDQKLAAIITPAAKPNILASNFRLTEGVKKTTDAPRAVKPQVKSVAKNAYQTGCSS
jgi:hypothetical protein